MRKMIGYKTFLLTVVITFVVITAAFAAMITGRDVIIGSEAHTDEKRMEKLSNELLKEYEYYGGQDVYVMRFFNEENQTGIVCVLEDDSNEILELHINFTQINLHESISSLIPELNKMYGIDTEGFVQQYCEDHLMDHKTTQISDMNSDELFEMTEKIREETGVQL